jgi:hypothetical protein
MFPPEAQAAIRPNASASANGLDRGLPSLSVRTMPMTVPQC